MRRTLAICRKELMQYFYSPVSYVAFAFYFALMGIFFSVQFLGTGIVDVRSLFGNIMVIYLFVIPLLTMRLISDEFRHGTDELLLTSPAGIGEIVVGKYLAAIVVQLFLVLGSFLYPFILSQFGTIDQPVLWMTYLSVFLLGISMMAVGLLASSFSDNQMVAGIAGFALIMLLWMIDWVAETVSGRAKEFMMQFSLYFRMQDFSKGIFDLTDLLFYAMFVAVLLVLTSQILVRKRWR